MKDVVARALGRQRLATGEKSDEVGAPSRELKSRAGDPEAPNGGLDGGRGGTVAALEHGSVRGGRVRVGVATLAGPVRIHWADALRVRTAMVRSLAVRRGVLGAVDD